MRILALSALLLAAYPAIAGDLVVQVRTADGEPVSNAVISLYPGGRPAPLGTSGRSYQVAQRDLQFSPFVLVVPVGSKVSFPNFDNVRHHVYSFSPVRRFELRLFAREQSRKIDFDKPGIVPVGCNIHDGMIAFVAVADTTFANKTDAAGRVVFTNVPAGSVDARVWHPYLRAPGNRLEFQWHVPRTGRQSQTVNMRLRPRPRHNHNY